MVKGATAAVAEVVKIKADGISTAEGKGVQALLPQHTQNPQQQGSVTVVPQIECTVVNNPMVSVAVNGPGED